MDRDGSPPRHASASAFALPLLLIDLGLDDIFENIAESLYEGAFDIIELMFANTIGDLLQIPPSRLALMQDMWELSLAVYFSLLGILGLSYLGMFQLFPMSKKTDPYRFMGRAFAATISLFIVNPPGGMNTLFSQGAFAWALEITNVLIDYFLLNMTYSPNGFNGAVNGLLGGAALGAFGLMAFGMLMLLVVGVLVLVLYVVLAARELVILVTFGLYPLLIVFWVADVGPMKYGKELSGKLFKATGMLIPLGILLAGILAAAGQMMTGSLVNVGNTNPLVSVVMVTLPIPVAAFMMIMMTMAPLKMAGVGLGAAAGQASSAASKVGRKGKSLAQKGTGSGGGALGGLGGGVAGAGFVGDDDGQQGIPGQGQAQQGFHSEGGGQVQNEVAPEPDQSTAVAGQSSLGQFEDGESPDQAAVASTTGGQEYTDPEAGQSTDSQASVDQQPETGYTPGDLTMDEAMERADGNKELASTMVAMDDYLAEQQDSTLVSTIKEGGKGMMGGLGGATAGAVVAGSAPLIVTMGAAAGFGAAAGAAGYGLTKGIDRAKPAINNMKNSLPSIGGSSEQSGSGDGMSTDDTKY